MTSEPARGATTVDAFAAVRRLSFAVLSAGDHSAVYRALVTEIFAVLGVDQVHVSRLSQDYVIGRGNCYRPGAGGVPEVGPEYEQHFDEASGVKKVALTGEPLNEPNVASSSVLDQTLAERYNAASALFVPLAFDRQVRAVIGCISEIECKFADQDVELVSTLANQAAAAIGVLDMRARMSARAEHQTALARAARSLNARLDLQACLLYTSPSPRD